LFPPLSFLCSHFLSLSQSFFSFFYRVKCITDALNHIKNINSEGSQKTDLNINDNDKDILNNENGNVEKTELATVTDFNFHGNKEIFYYEVCGKILYY
jgi:hypothetical protein